MKKVIFAFIIACIAIAKCHAQITKNNPPEVVAFSNQTRLIKSITDQQDTFYIISYVNTIRNHQTKMFSIGTTEQARDFFNTIDQMYKKPNFKDSYTVNTATGLLSIYWFQNNITVSQNEYSALVISRAALTKLKQF